MKNPHYQLNQFRYYQLDSLPRRMVTLFILTFILFGTACTRPTNTEIPAPPETQEIATPLPNDGTYDWRDTKLTLSQALPESPAEANVYSLKLSQPATMDEVRALANQFGLNGEMTETPGEIPGNFDYLIIDGKQKLTVRSDHLFTYYSDFENFTLGKLPGGQALAVIDNFLKQHNFNFAYNVEMGIENEGRQYGILPLTPDGYEISFDYMMPLRFDITLDDNRNIIFSGYLINPEQLGSFGIHTAEEALQKVLNSNQQFGMMEIFRGNGGGGGGSSFYKLNLSGAPVSFPTPTPAPSSDRSEYIVQEGDTLTSIAESHGINTEELMQINGLSESRIFIGQVLIIPDGQSSPPAGSQPVESLCSMLSVTFHKKGGGSQVTEYSLTGTDQSGEYYSLLLTGANLQGLEKYHGLPIIVWGTKNAEQFTVNVERYEIPFPDLQFQILKGRQELTTLDSQSVIIFTAEDGASYVQLSPSGDPTDAIIGIQGDLIELEVLIIPDEIFGGMPALRIYAGSTIEGGTAALTVTANQPYTYDDSLNIAPDNYVPPTATVEKMELAYYIRNPIYSMTDPNAGADAQYLQPVWRFYGHYSNGMNSRSSFKH